MLEGEASSEDSAMRVAVIAPPWIPIPPPAYGGTEMAIDALARGLATAGHDVTLATTGDSTCPVKRTWIYEHARTADMGDTAIELTHLLHAYQAVTGADIVHDHTLAGPVIGARRAGPPVVTTCHGPFTADVRALYRALGGRVPIIALSHHHASTAPDLHIARVIHHGVDVDRYPLGPGGDHLVFIGRMSPDKGVRQAIEIAQHAGVPLIIAAKMRDPGEHAYYRAEVEPLISGYIRYVGEVDTTAKLDLLGSARALLNPIRWDEPFGLNMIEALACGTPVITTPRGAAREIVDHGVTGFLASGTDQAVAAVAWAAKLDRRACRAAAEDDFSARRMVADHIAFYRDVLAGRVRDAA
jgi:glycosyltransferase involved in cell wall biosynthesis